MIFKTPEFFKKVLVVGSGSVANRSPLLLGELLRKCEDTIRLSRTYYSRTYGLAPKPVAMLIKLAAAIGYHILLPLSVMRAGMIFMLPSNNTEALVVSFWARLFRKPLLVDYYVSIYEWSCFMQRTTRAESKKGRWLLKNDRDAYLADGVIHCNRVEWKHIAEVVGLPARIEGFYHLPLFTNFDQLAEPLRPPAEKGPFVFGWWGSSMPLHGLQTIYEAFVKLSTERQDFELHLCFWGDVRRKEFEDGKDLASMPWLVIHDDLIAADGSLPRFINEKVHIGFSHYGTGPTAEYVYTNKVLECMALGRTALVADLPGNHEYGEIENLYFVSPPTVDGLLDAARFVLDHPEERKVRQARCLEEFHRHYSEAAAKRRFHEILESFHATWKAGGSKR